MKLNLLNLLFNRQTNQQCEKDYFFLLIKHILVTFFFGFLRTIPKISNNISFNHMIIEINTYAILV